LHYGTEKTMAAREKGLLGSDRVTDVQFAEFRQDPVAALEKVYNHLNLKFTPAIAKNMQSFLDHGAESKRHGKHTYSLASSGLDLDAERTRFAEYQTAYNIPSESF